MTMYQGVMDELKPQRAMLLDELRRLEKILEELDKLSQPTVVRRSVGGLSQRQAVLAALEALAHPSTTKEVVAWMTDHGFVFETTAPYPSVYSTLFRLSEGTGPVRRVRKLWMLRVWTAETPEPPSPPPEG